jgi:hypothetical protein
LLESAAAASARASLNARSNTARSRKRGRQAHGAAGAATVADLDEDIIDVVGDAPSDATLAPAPPVADVAPTAAAAGDAAVPDVEVAPAVPAPTTEKVVTERTEPPPPFVGTVKCCVKSCGKYYHYKCLSTLRYVLHVHALMNTVFSAALLGHCCVCSPRTTLGVS